MTGTASSGERKRRPPTEHAGEVTRKKNIGVEEIADPPPAFENPKIGGAADFLSQEFDIGDSDRVNQVKHLRDIGGVKAENFKRSRPVVLENAHPLAAQPGWRRVWTSLSQLQVWECKGLDDIFISDFCKACWDAKDTCRHPPPQA
ncbi:hypothetical protein N7537_005544 [Penicillium hordei]|uniref:Uncharacterized protein n=1 Tax=Penicillium hordei TaxID=40994 RepID=A0AAD6H296_9EURO|nr:uncharacterized protein N7537_005544 [Penicillium hordei]KAJ5602588.1 hypothetical protein N7537_005544 [Penicillium hordei]